MPKYRLIGGTRRSFVSMEEKVKAIADIYVKHTPAKDVLVPLYKRADRDLPKNLSTRRSTCCSPRWRAA